jgi:2,3-dihydroxy-p-cumate/2,3-dihydroxybenzoate 3,4-dioxygenase
MIEIVDLAYARVGTADLPSAVRFATETLGLQLVREEENRAYVRGDDRDHDICYVAGAPSDHVLGFELADEEALRDAFDTLKGAGVDVSHGTPEECNDRRVQQFITFQDPTGNKFDLAVRPHKATRRYFPTRDAGINGFSHVGLRTHRRTARRSVLDDTFQHPPE